MSDYGFASFEGPEAAGTTAFSFFPDAKADGGEQAVVNFRVDSLADVIAKLEAGRGKGGPEAR